MYQLASGHVAKSAPVDVPAEVEWSRLWRGFIRRRQVFLTVFIGLFTVIAVYTMMMPRSYTTHVKLIAGSGGTATSGQPMTTTGLPLLNALLAATGVQSTETYAELFQEMPVAERVVHDLRLPMSAGALLGHVSVRPVTNTTLLDLALTWPTAEGSAQVANAFAGAFVDQQRNLVASQADSAIASLTQQMPDAQRRAAKSQTALTQFQAANDLADIQTQTTNTINAAAAIDSKINGVQLDQRQSEAELSNVSGQLQHIGPTIGGDTSVAPNPVLSQLQTQLAQVNVQLQVAQSQYTDAHPAVIALKQQQTTIKQQLAKTPATVVASANTVPNPLFTQLTQQAATLRAQIASDGAQLAQLRVQHGQMAPKINALPAQAARLFDLQRDAKMTQDVLGALQQKLNEAEITKTTALSDVTITQPASAAYASVRPNRMLNLIIGLVVALALAAVVTLIMQALDRRLRDEQQISEEFELPVLASVPQLPELKNRLPGSGETVPLALPLSGKTQGTQAQLPPETKDEGWLRSLTVEAFLQLVTSLRYSATADRPMRTITVTSPDPGDGKSTIALNVAIAMAHVEPRVLLIDGDLRRPTLHSKLRRDLGRGLSDVLVGTAALDDVIIATDYEGLDLLTSGTRTPNSVKLIASQRFDQTLATLLDRYQTIIIDAPALVPVIDGAILATKADGTVLVVAMNTTNGGAVRTAIDKLHSVGAHNIVGTVANRVRPTRREAYDDYFYVEPPQDRLATGT
jgi:polysaccharide biosynthesis transport protein